MALLLASTMVLAQPTASAWYDTDWDYRKQITIDNTKVENENFTNFPVLINITDTDLQGHVGYENGQDIVFTDAGNGKIPHEIENYDNSTGTLWAWVRISTLYDNENTVIYMYYGNSTAGVQENTENVWDDNYMMVQHFQEDPTGTLYDSTANNNDGASDGAMTSGDQVPGQIDGSLDFDGSDDIIKVSDDDSIEMFTDDWTVSLWIKSRDVSAYTTVMQKASGTEKYALALRGNGRFRADIDDGPNLVVSTDDGIAVDDNIWRYVAVTFDRSANMTRYMNGGQYGTADSIVAANGSVDTGAIDLGISNSSTTFNGLIDDVRISDKVRSAGYILTSFNNENDPSSFFTIGDEESMGNWQTIETWVVFLNAPAEWTAIEDWTGSIYSPAPPTATIPDGPAMALPGSLIRITDNLTCVSPIDNVIATLNIDTNFSFLIDYPENVDMENFGVGQTKTAEWIVATPTAIGSFSYNVTWTYDDNIGTSSINSENSTIVVKYPTASAAPTNDSNAIALMAVGISILAILSVIGRWR